MPKNTWAEPCEDWIQLKFAVFTLLDVEEAQLSYWCEAAACRSESVKVEIDRRTATFVFYSHDGSTTAAPWIILKEEWWHQGFKYSATKLASRQDRKTQKREDFDWMKALRDATDFLWNKRLLPAFAEAITSGAVAIYARAHSRMSPFTQLPRDLWPVADVFDWPNGSAFGPDGSVYWSLHARSLLPPTSKLNAVSNYVEGTRGRRPLKREKVKQAMRADIQQGKLPLAKLEEMNEEALAATYDASRDTVRKARKEIISEFAAKPIIDKSQHDK